MAPNRAAASIFPTGKAREFVESMPRSYREILAPEAIQTHAAIVGRRGARAAHVEVWRQDPKGVLAVCVVVDDGPGVLARISAAFVAHDIDVVGAQGYCRKRNDGRVEAVDFFWIRRLERDTRFILHVGPVELERFTKTLEEGLVFGREGAHRAVRHTRTVPAAGKSTRVRFEHREPEGHMVLTLEGQDRPGLLLAITEALFRENVQIVRSEVSTQDGRVLDRFHMTEIGGAPLQRARLLGLQTAVLGAIEESLLTDGGELLEPRAPEGEPFGAGATTEKTPAKLGDARGTGPRSGTSSCRLKERLRS
jgi:[protein-PII] uridylyltransferase